jgi:hypothetical protein
MFEGLLALALQWPDPAPVDEAFSSKPHTGVYVLLFETSLFEPCDSDERWWLGAPGDMNDVFYDQYRAIKTALEQDTGETVNSPTIYLTANGRVSVPGEHGHMGEYHRQFAVEEIIEFRVATSDEHDRCLTSGFLPNGPVSEE